MKFKINVFAGIAFSGAFLLSAGSLATAQSDAARAIYESAASVETNVAGIRTFPAPAADFNPLAARARSMTGASRRQMHRSTTVWAALTY